MTKTNETPCTCAKTACGCGGATTKRCTCGNDCRCGGSCKCGESTAR